MSSHLLGEVQEVCDSVALIDRGKLLVYDSIDRLKTLTRVSKLEVTAVGAVPDITLQKVRQLENVRAVERVNGSVFLVTYDGSVEGRAELLARILAEGVKVGGFSPVGLPLEMLYMDLVKESR
jgi:ABC-2 type transport system ATP-binding protein